MADFDVAGSLEIAFEGAYGVFAVTNFWEHCSGAKEKIQVENIAKACEKCEIKHIVWSTLEDTRSVIGESSMALEGDYHVPHLDAKNEANAYFKDLPTTYLYTSFYYQNFIHFGMGPKKFGDSPYMVTFNIGDEKLPMVNVEDIGRMTSNIFNDKSLIDTD